MRWIGIVTCALIIARPGAGQRRQVDPRAAVTANASDRVQASDKNPYTSPPDVELGKQYFLGRCSYCHGAEGEGGRGVSLQTGEYRRGGLDGELFNTIRNGIPGSEMPATRLYDQEIWRIVAFIRTISTAGAAEKPTGDPVAGKIVYDTKGGCAACHVVNGAGGSLGPELSQIGLRRPLRYLREALVKPDAEIPVNYRGLVVTLKSGQTVTGVRLNEDDYSLQLREVGDNLRSLQKADIKQIRYDRPSLMPSYSSLSAKELDDLVAYLNSLRGQS